MIVTPVEPAPGELVPVDFLANLVVFFTSSLGYNAIAMLLKIFFTKEFAYFLVFGGLAATVNLLVGWLLYSGGSGMPYSLAVFLGASSGLLVNFLLNYAFNFRFRGRSMLRQFRTFFIVAAVGTLLTAVFARLFLLILNLLGIDGLNFGNEPISDKFMAHFLSVGTVTFYSFLAHKYLSFSQGIRHAFSRLSGKISHRTY